MIANEKKYLQATRLINTGTSKAKAARMVNVSYGGLCAWLRKEARKKKIEADVEELLAKNEANPRQPSASERAAFAKALLLTGMPKSEVAKMSGLKPSEVKILAETLAMQVSAQISENQARQASASQAEFYGRLPPLGTLKGENARLEELATNLRLRVEIYNLRKILSDVTPETDHTP